MKKVLALIATALLGCTTSSAGVAGVPAAPAAHVARHGVVELSESNTVVLHGVMEGPSTSKVLNQIIEKDRTLPKGEKLYLFIDSPGGSVQAGVEMLEGIKGLDREITTITSFGASMAFITVQSLGERLILPSGILMSHRAKGGVEGQIPGEMDTRYWFWKHYLSHVLAPVAHRLGMTVKQLQERHRDEWWTFGKEAVSEKTADKVVRVTCDASLSGSYQEKVQTLFGALDVTWSKCPLIKAPLKVDMKGISFKTMSAYERQDFNEAIKELFYDKRLFLNDYILTNRYKKYFQ